MWTGKIEEFKNCNLLDESVKNSILSFFSQNDLKTLPNGRYELDNGNYVNVCEFETQISDGVFEAHKNYIDIHCIIVGREKVLTSNKADKIVKEYDAQDDYYLCTVKESEGVSLTGDNICICLPDEPHNPGVADETSMTVKKAIFKIKAEYWIH